MHSLRVDNDRLNQLVKRGHITSSDGINGTTDIAARADARQAQKVTSEPKIPPDLEVASLPAKSLGIYCLSFFSGMHDLVCVAPNVGFSPSPHHHHRLLRHIVVGSEPY